MLLVPTPLSEAGWYYATKLLTLPDHLSSMPVASYRDMGTQQFRDRKGVPLIPNTGIQGLAKSLSTL